MIFYVYELKDQGIPFYVGKGKGKRAWSHLSRRFCKIDDHAHRKIRKIKEEGREVEVVLVYENLDEKLAFQLEKELIAAHRLSGIELTNKTDGGEGTSGFKFSDEGRNNISKSWTEERKIEQSNRQRGRARPEEVIRKMADGHKGKPGPNLGRSFSDDWRENISAAARQRLSPARTGPLSEDHKLKLKEAWIRRKARNNSS